MSDIGIGKGSARKRCSSTVVRRIPAAGPRVLVVADAAKAMYICGENVYDDY